MKFSTVAAVAAASALTVTLCVTPSQARNNNPTAPTISNATMLAEGLAGPLKVAFGPQGNTLVAEAFAGQLSSISPTGEKTTLVNAPGKEIAGVSYDRGTTYYFENAGSTGEEPPSGATPALLKSIDKLGNTRTIKDITKFEEDHNPDGSTVYGVRDATESCLADAPWMQSTGELYSHPFSSVPARNGVYVGDAGANTILHVNNHGTVSLVKALPAEPITVTEAVRDLAEGMELSVPDCMLGHTYWAQPVPTDITVQGDWLYYTVLPGVPGESLSSGKAYKMNLDTKKTQVIATGLSAPTGIALDHRGNVFVAELFGGGVARIVNGHAVTVLPAQMASDVAIHNGKLIASTDALTPSGKLVTATIK